MATGTRTATSGAMTDCGLALSAFTYRSSL